jgi:large subunit ribosomal protein L14e
MRQTFSRFVSIGRVVLINYGPDAGKIATIIDVVDENKALIDGPFSVTGVNRQVIPFKRVALTDLTIHIPRQPREATLKKALAKDNTVEKWGKTTWAKKIANKQTRANLSDFDRFKAMIARKQKASLVKKTIAAARKN